MILLNLKDLYEFKMKGDKMLTLDEMIEFENESTVLDFKREEYRSQEYERLIKDVMSMANAPINQTKYIIIGVKDIPGEDKQFQGLDYITDQANLENIIQENIEPIVKFKYYSYDYKGIMLGIMEIYGNNDQPYMMKKDYKNLCKGDIWIRKGTRQSRANREDLDRMLNYRNDNSFVNSVKLGFNNTINDNISAIVPTINKSEAPSNIVKVQYEEQLQKLKDYINKGTKENEKQSLSYLTGFVGLFSEYKSDKKEIRIGYNEFGLPIYSNEDDLVDKIKNVHKDYSYEDYYFYFEEKSIKINFMILNDGNSFLEEVSIKFWFNKEIFNVAVDLPEEPKDNYDILRINSTYTGSGYPEVTTESENYLVEEYFTSIRHKEPVQVFDEDLRVLVIKDKIGGTYKIPYRISARNLYEPINGEVKITLQSK